MNITCMDSQAAMLYCISLRCQNPRNPPKTRFCQSCGQQLLLKDRYRPVKPIGQGGFGRTFLAVDEHIPSQPSCVIKQLCFPERNATLFKKVVTLFHQEAARLDELGNHPQIPQLLAHFEQEQQLYLVQEFIRGRTLAQQLPQGVYSETQIWELLRDLLPVLQYIHEHRVIHRDIKPANIIRRENDRQLVLIDFGVAKLFSDTDLEHTGTIIGSPEYMAPEQTRGRTFPASDLYSLGVTCIHLLTNISPLEMFDIVNNQWVWRKFLPSENPVSPRLGKILDQLMQNALSQRYQDAGEVLQAINSVKKPTYTAPSAVSQSIQQPVISATASQVEIDYTRLRDLLAKKKWKEADYETWTLMCKVVGKPPGSYIFSGDIERFPCEDLGAINQLWVKYSKGRFGFSVQTQIYQDVGEEYGSFCQRVGWPTHIPYIPDSGLKFSDKALPGHLPSRRWAGGSQWWRHAGVMAAKLIQCSH